MAAGGTPCCGQFAVQWSLADHSDLAAVAATAVVPAAAAAAAAEAAHDIGAVAERGGCVWQAGSCFAWQALPDSLCLQTGHN